VAAGLIPFADGSDLAASVRNPASFCGVVGLRTTPGLVPGDPFDALGVVGPIARTAPDAALLLAGMCGIDPGLPVGLQLAGRYGADRGLLEIAAAIMELTGRNGLKG
jgi:amidase